MASYFDHLAVHPRNVTTIATAWSQDGEEPVFSAALNNASVSLYGDQCKRLPIDKIRNELDPSALLWHPVRRQLVVGWKDGSFYSWDREKYMEASDPKLNTHSHPGIATFLWNHDGTRLLCGDHNGVVSLWNTEKPHSFTMMGRKQVKGAVKHAELRKSSAAGTEFIFASAVGSLFTFSDDGTFEQLADLEANVPITTFLYEKSTDEVLAMNTNLNLAVFKLRGNTAEVALISKMSASNHGIAKVVWAGHRLIAMASNESFVRFFHLDDEHFLLHLPTEKNQSVAADKVVSLAFDASSGILAAGTDKGRVAFWQFSPDGPKGDGQWQPLPGASLKVEEVIGDMKWGPDSSGVLGVSLVNKVGIMVETAVLCTMKEKMSALQTLSTEMWLERTDGRRGTLQSPGPIKGVDVTAENAVAWGSNFVAVYQFSEGNCPKVGEFQQNVKSCAMGSEEGVYCAVDQRVNLCGFNGDVRSSISFTKDEGPPILISRMGNFLAIGTQTGLVRLYDISKHEPKAKSSKYFNEGLLKSIAVSCDGTKVAILATGVSGDPATKASSQLFVYNSDTDMIYSFDFAEFSACPVSINWDSHDGRLIGCEAKVSGKRTGPSVTHIVTLFVTPDGLMVQDSFPTPREYEALLGIDVPHFYFALRGRTANHSRVKAKVMRDFTGMETVDSKTRHALLNFSYHMTVGNMDEAYKSVKLVQSSTVWENMAQMCVKTRRLNVAEVCLGNMSHARASRALRESEAEPEEDARIAIIAIHLGLYDDAERLLNGCGRYDILNNFFQASGKWEKALKIAETEDRLHLRTTHYNYAKHLEKVDEWSKAITHYEASETHKVEIPRMLLKMGLFDQLREYVEKKREPQLCKWWAQLLESQTKYEQALEYYQIASDFLSVVRVLCFLNRVQEAQQIATESGSSTALYHVGKYFESVNQVTEAINLYTRSGRLSHAVRLAKENGKDNELMSLAIQSNAGSTMVEVAKYFEEVEQYNRAVVLYKRSGNATKAVQLCFRAQLFEELGSVVDSLGSETSPELLSRCAEFFMDNNQYDKAVSLCITGKQYVRALELAQKHGVHVTDEMADSMTPEKSNDENENKFRINILKTIAKVCRQQGSYNLATRKYTQAGDKVKAMKTLILSGDKEKIIFFAGVSKMKEVYVLAANYLQTLQNHDTDDMKKIIQFYEKAKAYDSLSAFYDHCSQVEIDEYRDYEKAMSALRESLKFMTKYAQLKKVSADTYVRPIEERIGVVEKFVQARRLVQTDPNEMVNICNRLLNELHADSTIRVGDVFALLIEFYHSKGEMEDAHHYIEKMRMQNIILSPYLDSTMVENIYRSVGKEPPRDHEDGGEGEVDEDELDEEIEEGIDDYE